MNEHLLNKENKQDIPKIFNMNLKLPSLSDFEIWNKRRIGRCESYFITVLVLAVSIAIMIDSLIIWPLILIMILISGLVTEPIVERKFKNKITSKLNDIERIFGKMKMFESISFLGTSDTKNDYVMFGLDAIAKFNEIIVDIKSSKCYYLSPSSINTVAIISANAEELKTHLLDYIEYAELDIQYDSLLEPTDSVATMNEIFNQVPLNRLTKNNFKWMFESHWLVNTTCRGFDDTPKWLDYRHIYVGEFKYVGMNSDNPYDNVNKNQKYKILKFGEDFKPKCNKGIFSILGDSSTLVQPERYTKIYRIDLERFLNQ